MIIILGGAKTGYNLYRLLRKMGVDSMYLYFKGEYGEGKKGGFPIEQFKQIDIKDTVIISSETAFVNFREQLETKFSIHYYLRDKQNLSSIGKKLNVNNITEQSLESLVYPAFVKPKESGKNNVPFKTKIINSSDELNKISSYIDDCLIQEFLSPEDYEQIDIGGYFNGSSNSLISFVELNQYPRGIASYITQYNTPTVDQIKNKIQNLLNDLNYRGFIELEFKRHKKKNVFYLMDVNPRPWGSFYYYISSITNVKEMIINYEEPIFRLKKSWVNLPRLVLSNIQGNFINPPLKDILLNEICYEPFLYK